MTVAASDRDVSWDGMANVRDLGGLPTPSGALARGRVFRGARPDGLTAAGHAALRAAGVATIVDLRSDWERDPREITGVTVVRAPIEDVDDREFYDWWHREGAPYMFPATVERWPARIAAAIEAIADAPDGAVLVHCSAGRDRTGMIVALILQEAGVPTDEIVEDYATAMRSIRAHFATVPDAPERPLPEDEFAARLARNSTDLAEFLATVDTRALLAAGGADPDTLTRAAGRLRA